MVNSQKMILLIGPSGSGKSTLCNAIFHQNVDFPSLEKPAGVSRRAKGETSNITHYWCDGSIVVTDTIGFDDHRYKPEFVAEQLRRMVKDKNVKYEKVILCLRLGRVSEPARVLLRLLKAIFDDPTSNMILYISGCEDGTTAEQFIQDNAKGGKGGKGREGGEDDDIKQLINSLEKQTKKNKKKGIELENIITGTLQSHQDGDIDERKFLEDRKETLNKIMTAIRIDIGFVNVKPFSDLWEAIAEWFVWHFKKKFKAKKLSAQASNETLEIKYTYGTCSLCEDDNNEGWILLIPCYHRFHVNCFRKEHSRICPFCNVDVEDADSLP